MAGFNTLLSAVRRVPCLYLLAIRHLHDMRVSFYLSFFRLFCEQNANLAAKLVSSLAAIRSANTD